MAFLLDRFARLVGVRAPQALAPRDAYALWADTYPPRPHNPLMETEQAIVAPLIASTTPTRALDVGTGSGRNLPFLLSAGARFAVGVDFSLPMLRREACSVPRVCGDACRLPFPDATFDLVSSSLMAGDVENLGGWVREAARVLTPGGHLIYSDFHPSWTAHGWRRTFRTAEGRLVELAYYPHAIDEHLGLLEQSFLAVRTIREPRVAGQAAPALVVFHAVKRGPAAEIGRRPGSPSWRPGEASVQPGAAPGRRAT